MKVQILFDRVHHGFCSHPMEYPWSSYSTCISTKKTKLKRDEVVEWFGGDTTFKEKHKEKLTTNEMDDWLEI